MAYFRVNLLRLNNYHTILNLNVALSRNLGILKMFHDWFLSRTWKRMEPRNIMEHNFFVYRVSVGTSMKKKAFLRASPNLISNCFLGRKNFSLHYHCLYRHHFKTGEGRGYANVRLWLGTDTLTKESPAFYTVQSDCLRLCTSYLSLYFPVIGSGSRAPTQCSK